MSIEKEILPEGKPEQIRYIEIDEVPDIEQFVQEIMDLPIEEQIGRISSFVKSKLKNALNPKNKHLPDEEKTKIKESLDRSKIKKMSQVLATGYGVCVEYNALAEMIFDKLRIPCEFKSGQMGDGPKHTFLDISVNDEWQIFDPYAEVYLSDIGRPELTRFGEEYYKSSNTNK